MKKSKLLVGKKTTCFQVDVEDVDKAITKFLKLKKYREKNFNKHGYKCTDQNEWYSNQSYTFSVFPYPSAHIVPVYLTDIDDLCTDDILCWMCTEGYCAKGDYCINC